MSNVIVWDIETVPDLKGFAAANGLTGKSDEEVRAELGDKFPKHIYHSIICIGALVAHRPDGGHWIFDALGAPHVGERSEKQLITAFVDRIRALSPQLVTFNGSSFDLPVLRYRAMVHSITAPGLAARPYFHRYTDDAIDLCDVLSSFSPQGKATLHELCRVIGLPGKPDFAKDIPAKNQFLNFPTGHFDFPNALAYCLQMRPGQPVYPDFSVRNVVEELPTGPTRRRRHRDR
jgi:predicted PolB exonuclease-like 3'-5' exonuclease